LWEVNHAHSKVDRGLDGVEPGSRRLLSEH
jgi:hypothetical protein